MHLIHHVCTSVCLCTCIYMNISIQVWEGKEVAVTNDSSARYCGNCSGCANSCNVTTGGDLHPILPVTITNFMFCFHAA